MATKNNQELQTKDLSGVEILSPGRWNGDPYSEADLDEIVTNFPLLKGKIDPVGKLGHDGNQKLAQQDGYPAIGWVTKVYRQGTKLLADFKDIPAKVADLIAAHAYDKVSSEVYFNLSLDGKTYKRVLKNVAFLGADMPAVKDIKSISDVAALYKGEDADVHVAEYAEDPDGDGDDDSSSNRKKNPDAAEDAGDDGDAELGEDDMTTLLAAHDAHMARMEGLIAGKPGAKRVRTFMNASRRELASIKTPFKANKESTDMETKKLAEMLGLPATATESDIEAAIKAKNEKPTEGTLSEAEAKTLREQVAASAVSIAELKASAKTTRIASLIDGAVSEGKSWPAERDDLVAIGLLDEERLEKMLSGRSKKLGLLSGAIGHDEKPGKKDVEPSDAEVEVARQLGVSVTKLAEYTADDMSFEERQKKAKEESVALSMRRPVAS